MKVLLYLLLPLLFVGCGKSSDEPAPEPPSGFIVEVQKNDKLSNGTVVARYTGGALIQVWKAEGRDLQVRSSSDVQAGYVWDASSSGSVKSEMAGISDRLALHVHPGQYFVVVMLGENAGAGRLAYSYTRFEVKKGEITSLKKVFTSQVTASSYEEWNKTE